MTCGVNRQVRQAETKDAAEYHPAYAVCRRDLPMRNAEMSSPIWAAQQSKPHPSAFPVFASSTVLLILMA